MIPGQSQSAPQSDGYAMGDEDEQLRGLAALSPQGIGGGDW